MAGSNLHRTDSDDSLILSQEVEEQAQGQGQRNGQYLSLQQDEQEDNSEFL